MIDQPLLAGNSIRSGNAADLGLWPLTGNRVTLQSSRNTSVRRSTISNAPEPYLSLRPVYNIDMSQSLSLVIEPRGPSGLSSILIEEAYYDDNIDCNLISSLAIRGCLMGRTKCTPRTIRDAYGRLYEATEKLSGVWRKAGSYGGQKSEDFYITDSTLRNGAEVLLRRSGLSLQSETSSPASGPLRRSSNLIAPVFTESRPKSDEIEIAKRIREKQAKEKEDDRKRKEAALKYGFSSSQSERSSSTTGHSR